MLRSENIVPVTLYNNNVSAVCWHNKTKATPLHRTTVYLSVTVAFQSLIEKKQELFYFQTILYIVLIGLMDCLRECIR